ncbi:MAG TPA: tetratricopeptide repeat protein [Gemmataceae bacterium]
MADTPPQKITDIVQAEKALTAEQITIDTLNMGGPPPPPSSARPVQKPPRNLPPPNKQFVGRKQELKDIHHRLTHTQDVGVTQQTAAHGHGGVGKTCVAIKYAWEHLADYPGGLFFLNCDTDLLLPEVAALAEPLGLDLGKTSDETARRVKQLLEAGEPALLILDNVRGGKQWTDKKWAEYLPGGACRRLITTRAHHLAPGLDMVPIERLPRPDGVKLLARYRKDAALKEWKEIVGDIVDWFDGLAVGLTVVGAYMARYPNLTWKQYAGSLDAKGLGAVRATEAFVGPLPDYDRRVDAVFCELVEALPGEQQRALEYAALLPEDTVRADWLAWLLERDGIKLPDPPPGYDGVPGKAVTAELRNQQILLTRGEHEEQLGLHRVLRRRLLEQVGKRPEHREQLLDIIGELAEARGKASHDALMNQALREELSPLMALSKELRNHERIPQAASLANWLHTPLRNLGRFAEGRALLSSYEDDQSLALLTPEEGGILLSNLSLVLKSLGDPTGARERIDRAIRIGEATLPPNHLLLGGRYINRATILQDLGDLAGAREWTERAIQIEEKHFSPDHPNLAVQYNNLALILKAQGDLPAARGQIERAIRIDEKNLPPDHPDLAVRYSNLATILHDLGDLTGARDRIGRAIQIEEANLPAEHPNLAIRFNNLGHILRDLGHRAEAYDSFRRALAILTKHFPPTDPRVQSVTQTLKTHCRDATPKS